MQKLQCAVSNSVSHLIVILIYTDCFLYSILKHQAEHHIVIPWGFI